MTTAGDADSLRVARLAVRLSARLTDYCQCRRCRRCRRRPIKSNALAASFARLAAALRMRNRLEHAESALRIAFDFEEGDLTGDLRRRRAWLRIYQDRLPEAVADAKFSVGAARGEDRGLALGALGLAYLYSGEHEAAISALREGVESLDPAIEYRYCGMLVSYAAALAKGRTEDAAEAIRICQDLRRNRLKDQHKMQRAKTWWVEGLLYSRLGDSQTAWQALDIARRSLKALKAEPEIAAIVADMAQISLQRPAVRHICAEAAEVISGSHPLAEPLNNLARAAPDLIPEAAAALREAASALAPCPSL